MRSDGWLPGGRSPVVRAQAAQARDPGSNSHWLLVFTTSIFACYYVECGECIKTSHLGSNPGSLAWGDRTQGPLLEGIEPRVPCLRGSNPGSLAWGDRTQGPLLEGIEPRFLAWGDRTQGVELVWDCVELVWDCVELVWVCEWNWYELCLLKHISLLQTRPM